MKYPTPSRSGDRVLFVRVSGNRKTGPIPVSITDRGSCPSTCSFYDAGCYALQHHTGRNWARVPHVGLAWEDFCRQIAALPKGQIWRHNEAGDLPGRDTRIDTRKLAALVAANRGRRGFTFTHKPLTAANVRAIRDANAGGLAVNVSTESLREADRAAALGLPVAVVLPGDAPTRATRTPEGRTVVVCPAETAGLTCDRCQLCAKGDRKAIVGFRAHGAQRNVVTQLVRGKR